MIKILNVITDTNIGGAGRVLVHYLKNFDRTRYDVYVALPKGSLLTGEIEKAGYTPILTEYGRDESFELPAVRELYGIIKELRLDIVHTHSSLSAKLAAYLAGVKSRIYTRHCAFDLPASATSFPRKQISGLVNNTLSTAIVAVVDAAAKNLTDTGVDPKKITVIMNGVEGLREISEEEKLSLRAELGIAKDDFVCTMSARLEDVKGHDYFIRAAKLVCEKRDNVKFLIVGTGTLEKELKELASSLGLDRKVIFAGFTNDVAPYVNITDLNVNCSWGTEASSLAIAEAMSLGKPTLASIFGGNPSMITEGENGMLVPKRDENAIADAILRIEGERGLVQKLGEGAKRIYEKRFTAAAMTRQLEALYDKEAERIKAK
ncbi:MAG: glycosyltransferase [Clostridia bacterium]|nr:glycosyltransferase [Clostridia bacterium]